MIGAYLQLLLTMNYIHHLQSEVRCLKDQVAALEEGIKHLRDYAFLPKFNVNEYIHKQDVINRCQDALSNGFHAETGRPPVEFDD